MLDPSENSVVLSGTSKFWNFCCWLSNLSLFLIIWAGVWHDLAQELYSTSGQGKNLWFSKNNFGKRLKKEELLRVSQQGYLSKNRKDVGEKTSEKRRRWKAKPVGGEEATASLIRAEEQNRTEQEDVDGLHINPEGGRI
jgi:hypothetical protein